DAERGPAPRPLGQPAGHLLELVAEALAGALDEGALLLDGDVALFADPDHVIAGDHGLVERGHAERLAVEGDLGALGIRSDDDRRRPARERVELGSQGRGLGLDQPADVDDTTDLAAV